MRRRRGDGKESGFGRVGKSELEELTGAGVRPSEIGRIRNVDGQVEERLGGRVDKGERGLDPSGGVLA